jgi:cysteine-rich repeat protein
MKTHLLLVIAALATLASACPTTPAAVDAFRRADSGASEDANLGIDAFSADDAFVATDFCATAAASDGDFCTIEGSANLRICSGGLCVRSQCGDGFIDDRTTGGATEGREACDDGNDIANDGCELDCTITCTAATGAVDCDDMNPCTDDVCTMSSCRNNPNTNACMVGGAASTCSGGVCPAPSCGNGMRDGSELCDDGNDVSGDGCEADCTPSCTSNEQCEDGVACNGVFTCNAPPDGTRRCVEMARPVACADDGNRCTTEMCVDGVGCVSDGSANDVDRDGYYATSCGGNDCDDTSAARHPGLAEVCGNRIDDDCSATTPDDARTSYFVDCDRDTYAASTTGSMLVCMAPSTPPLCRGLVGAWTTRAPVDAGTTDCNASNVDVSPAQTRYFSTGIAGAAAAADFDYNCDGIESTEFTFGGRYFCTELRATCVGTSHYTTAPVCGASALVNRCVRNRLGTCSFATSAAAPVACR